jgi:hypothetical protein
MYEKQNNYQYLKIPKHNTWAAAVDGGVAGHREAASTAVHGAG